jgi:hypothetical protein
MKRTLVLAAILILSCTFVAQQQQNQTRYPKAVYIGPAGPLTVNDVIELSRAGVHDERIIAELEKNTQSFHLTSNDVTRLKHAGVSQSVIQAMIDVPFSPGAQASALAGTASPAGVKPASTTQPGGVSAQPPNSPPAVNSPPLSEPAQPALPTEPGLYVLSGQSRTKILGQPVTFERSGSKLVSGLTLSIKAAHNNVQLPGRHAQTATGNKPMFAFLPSQHERENGVTGGDLLLISLEVHGDRRQIEVAAAGSWRNSSGISITHQLQAFRSEPSSGLYEITPTEPLKPGEYAVYLQRGEGLPAVLYDFSVQGTQ